ncbi:MAG TPA: NAD(P)H-dependent oxidoreductase subunit E, partial [Actinomycetota bacterium]|nr:NAD(P)H-dependent oxidoreductase subunit E [Actinomycetota bacterium]
MTAEPSAEERAAVDEVLGPPETGWDGGDRTARDLRVSRVPEDERTLLLPVLHALQGRIGWISEGGLNYACERLQVPPAEAYGVATFYAMFSVTERPTTVVHVCDDLACRVNGGRELLDAATAEGHDRVQIVASPCLGGCERAPVALVQRAGTS